MIISMTAYNRPEYLKPVLESLEEAIYICDEPVFVVVSIDYSDRWMEIADMLPHGRGWYHYYSDREKGGLQRNTLRALDYGWSLARRLGEDFVLHLEDDLLLAPDALEMACWMRDECRNVEDIGFVTLTNVHNDPVPEKYGNVYRSPWFECHAWGTWRPVWRRLRDNWPHEWDDHWAARVNDLEMFGLLQALPELSRSKSIGEYGVHSNSDYHAQHNPKVYAGDIEYPVQRYTLEMNVPVRQRSTS
jgi:hypothetical protein